MFDDENEPQNTDDTFEQEVERLAKAWWPPVVAFVLLIAAIWGWYDARTEDLLICRIPGDCHQAALSREVMMGVFIAAAFVALVVTLIQAAHKALPPEE